MQNAIACPRQRICACKLRGALATAMLALRRPGALEQRWHLRCAIMSYPSKTHLWRLEGVVRREMNVHHEDTARVWAIAGSAAHLPCDHQMWSCQAGSNIKFTKLHISNCMPARNRYGDSSESLACSRRRSNTQGRGIQARCSPRNTTMITHPMMVACQWNRSSCDTGPASSSGW